jgi:hypothetical protein
MKDKFRNKNGDLSAYSFACGYVQEKQTNNGKVELYKDGNWHVRIFDDQPHGRWVSFDTLGEARKAFRKA